MQYAEFVQKFLNDMKVKFKEVTIINNEISIRNGISSAKLDLMNIYREYREVKYYESILQDYANAVNQILSNYKFKFSKNNVYPFLKKSTFGHDCGMHFVRKDFLDDICIFFVADMGTTFRFVCKEDTGGFADIEAWAFRNLNKITNSLSRVYDDFEVYSLKWNCDYAATMILADSIKAKINHVLGKRYLFAIPNSRTLLLSPVTNQYADLLKHFISISLDVNKISENVYVCINGKYSVYAKTDKKENHLQLVK